MSPSLLPRGSGLTFKETVFPRTRRRAPAAGAPSPPGQGLAPGPGVADPGVGASELAGKRDELARQFAELQWDLGGIAYEMAIRDHFRLDVLVRQAARLQAVDAELGAAERMLRMEHAGAAGTCSSCGALFPRGAVFCWQCGNDLMRRDSVQSPSAQPVPGQPPAQPTPPISRGEHHVAPGGGAGFDPESLRPSATIGGPPA